MKYISYKKRKLDLFMKKFLNLLSFALVLIFMLNACQTVKNTKDKVTSVFDKSSQMPEMDDNGVVDVSKTTSIEQIEQFTATIPTGQWVYIENDLQGIYSLQNKSVDGSRLFIRLNCKSENQKTGFIIQNKASQDVLRSNDDKIGQIQILLDNKNFLNPFDGYNVKKIEVFKNALIKAKEIKIYNASTLYTFKNGNAELLNKPVTCKD